MSNPQGRSYGRILKSSALLGGSSLVNVLLGMVRVKVLAVELGPALFGVMSLYTSLTAMIGSIASLGIGQSAVREIAEAAGAENESRVARIVATLKRVVWLTGGIGLFATIAIAWPASWWTFGSHDHALAIAILGVTVLFAQLQAGQRAVLSGLRRVRDVALINVVGAFWSTVLAIPILLVYREDGIVPFLIAVAVGQFAASWWYARRASVRKVQLTWRETLQESREMVRLGLAIVVSGLALDVSTYLIRLILQIEIGAEAVGLYQSAFTISGIYVGFILQAMGGDYFPRLAAVGEDRAARNKLVNEQAEMAMLLAAPALVAALVVSEVLIWLLYSERFAGASDILRWQVLGLLGRIVTWPLGFILLARSDRLAFLASELVVAGMHVLMVWLAVKAFGLAGAGIGFASQYVLYLALILLTVKYRHGHVWDGEARRLIMAGGVLVVCAFGSTFIADTIWRYAIGGLTLFATLVWAAHGLVRRLGMASIGQLIRKIVDRLNVNKVEDK